MSEAPKTIEEVLKTALKKYDLRVGSLADVVEDVTALTTGNLAIDTAIGVGGIPLRRSAELYGPPSSGKTTTGLQICAELQKVILAGGDPVRGIGPDDVILYVDWEQATDETYAARLGLDLKHKSFLFTQPDNFEQGANVVRQLIATGKVRLVVWDSVAAATPQAALEAETGKASVAIQARLMSDFMKAINSLLNQYNCALVLINHLAEAIDIGGRPGVKRYTTPGGRAAKFYASVRLEYQQVQNIKGKMKDPVTNEEIEQVVASVVRVRVVKNKVGPPFRQALVRVRFGRGFDNFWTAVQVLVAQKKIVYSSGYFYFERSPELVWDGMPAQASGSKRPYLRGDEALFAFADENPQWRHACIAEAERVVAENSNVVRQLVQTGEVDPDPEEEQEPSSPPSLVDGDATAALLG